MPARKIRQPRSTRPPGSRIVSEAEIPIPVTTGTEQMDGDPPDIGLRGLSEQEAADRLKREGPNTLPEAARRTFGRMILEIVREPMFALLLGAAVIYLVLGDFREAVVLAIFASTSVLIAVVQEARTERVLESLRDLTSPRALVIRDGVEKRIAGRGGAQRACHPCRGRPRPGRRPALPQAGRASARCLRVPRYPPIVGIAFASGLAAMFLLELAKKLAHPFLAARSAGQPVNQ